MGSTKKCNAPKEYLLYLEYGRGVHNFIVWQRWPHLLGQHKKWVVVWGIGGSWRGICLLGVSSASNEYVSRKAFTPVGVSEGVSKAYYSDHYLANAHNLFGCPEIEIWTSTPSQFSSATVTDNGSSITVQAVHGRDVLHKRVLGWSALWMLMEIRLRILSLLLSMAMNP